MAVPAITSCHSGPIWCPVNLDQVSSQLGTSTAAVFAQKQKTKNKPQRQYTIIFPYILVRYHFAVHPPFKQQQFILIKPVQPLGSLLMTQVHYNDLFFKIGQYFGPRVSIYFKAMFGQAKVNFE